MISKQNTSSEYKRAGWGDAMFFMRFARPVRHLAIWGGVLTLLASALGAVLPLGGKVLIDFAVLGGDMDHVVRVLSTLGLASMADSVSLALRSPAMIVFAMLILGLAAGGVGTLQKWTAYRFQQEVIYNVQSGLFERLLRFPVSFFRASRTGYLMSRVSTDIMGLHVLFSETWTRVAARALFGAFGLIIAFLLSVKLALVITVLLPLGIVLNAVFAGRLRRSSGDELERTAEISEGLQETLSGIDTLKAHGAEQHEGGRISGAARKLVDARMRSTAISMTSEQASRALLFGTTLLVMLLGAYEMRAGAMSLGDYVAFTAYAAAVAGAINSVSATVLMFQPSLAAASRLRELFAVAGEMQGGSVPSTCNGEIEFSGVSFSYDGKTSVLKTVSFKARPGRVLALAGPSGAGKTTVVNLLLHFFNPQEGVIRLDGRDVREMNVSWLRSRIGVASQDVFLFYGTVKDNISYGVPGADDADIERAARMAGIHDEIMSMPQGYGTMVGERGLALSAGQRQLISLARVFMRDPAVLVLDEPSSALDETSERQVKAAIEEFTRTRTVIIIAHRRALIEAAHAVVVLDRGEVVEQGAPDELTTRGGLFTRLYDASV